jgi:histidyl-tRNA synthetase
MHERGMFPGALGLAAASVMVTIWDADSVANALRLAGELRAHGLRVELYPEADKIDKQIKYASSRGIRFITIEGQSETALGQVAVKNLTTREQQSVPRGRVAEYIRANLSSSDDLPGPGAWPEA